MPPVSAVMPAYNAVEFISVALGNLIAQGFQEREHVVVDDGSTYHMLVVIEQYAVQYPLCSYPTIKNSDSCKIPYAKGIVKATPEWIVSLYADDYFDLNLIERLAQRQKQTNVDV